MKYSILGFNQEEVLKLKATIDDDENKKSKNIQIDITDLLILRVLADFMNRSKIIKYIVNDKTYFSVQYKVLLEDLPVLNIKQQALSDRLNKMAYFKLIEKIVIKNQSGSYTAFRMGEQYEKLKYVGKDSEIQVQEYQTTSAEVINYNPKDSSTNNSSTNKEDIDKSISKKVFENFRNSYQGTKRGLEVEFKNFTKHKDWKKVLPLLGKALEREITHRNNLLANNQFCPCWAHLSTWINQRRWEQEFESVESQQKEKDIVKPTLNMKF